MLSYVCNGPICLKQAAVFGPERAPKRYADILFGNPYDTATAASTAETAGINHGRQHTEA